MAAINLAKSIQRLYKNRDDDKLADFVIESSDGKQIKVHPLILLSRFTQCYEKYENDTCILLLGGQISSRKC